MKESKFFLRTLLIGVFSFIFIASNLAYATTVGPNNPATNVSDSSIGTVAWTNRDYDRTSNDQYATTQGMNSDVATVYLKATNFGFVPTGAIIDGISVSVERKASDTSFFDNAVRIVKGGTVGTIDKSSGVAWSTVDATSTYGGLTDLWGETWTATDINNADFGVALSVKKVGGAVNQRPSIDWINITVNYHTPVPLTGSIVAPTAGALATTTVTLQATVANSDFGVDKVEFYIDSEVLMGSTNTPADGTYAISWTPVDKGLASGEHYIFAKLYDLAGNSTTTSSQLLNIDVTIPVGTDISYDPSGATREDVVATLATNRPTRLNGLGEATTTFTHVFIDNGSYTFNYTDEVGHSGSSVAIVNNIDRSAPVISGVLPIAGNSVGSGAVLNFSSSEFNDPGCQVDGLNWGSPCNGSTFMAIPGWGNVAEGRFTLTIKDTDSAGNIGTIDTIYIKDTIAPNFVSATVTDATTVKVKFSEDLETDSTKSHYLSVNDFEVSVGGVINPIASLSENNGLITLTMTNSFAGTNPAVQLILNPTQPESIADPAGNVYTSKNIITPVDGMASTIISAETNGTRSFVLTFSEDLNDSILAENFSVYVLRNNSSISLPVSNISYSDKQITLNLNSDMAYGDTIHYNISSNSSISDLAGNLLNGGLAYTGTANNNISAPIPSGSGGGGSGGSGGSRTSGNVKPAVIVSVVPTISGGTFLGTSTFRFLNDLSRGMENNDVKELQLRLSKEGYLKVLATGYFGPNTFLAVRSYQRDNKLPVTGYFGPLTRSLMNNGLNNKYSIAEINNLLEQIKYIQGLLKIKNQ